MGEIFEAIPFLLILWVLFEVLTGRRRKRGTAGEDPPSPRPAPSPGGARPEGAGGAAPGRRREPEGAGSEGSAGAAPGRRREPAMRGAESGSAESSSGSAVDMLPDDLWAVLTGQPRPQTRVPTPEPTEQAATTEPATTVRAGHEREGAAGRTRYERSGTRDRDAESLRGTDPGQLVGQAPQPTGGGSLETIPTRTEPRVVSLEGPPPPPAVRHAAFHRRLAASKDAAGSRPTRRRVRFSLGSRSELHRAIVLREVLGPPRGLD